MLKSRNIREKKRARDRGARGRRERRRERGGGGREKD
jgi:hypothetical protein